MEEPIRAWLHPFLVYEDEMYVSDKRDFIGRLGMALRVQTPLITAQDVRDRMRRDLQWALDVVGFALSEVEADYYGESQANELDNILKRGGSAWEVTRTESGFRLTRRDLAAAKDAIAEVREVADRPAEFLTDAWTKIATRDPDPSGAYDKAIKAVEAAAQPVVSPANDKATLGTIIRDMKAKPQKWTFALGNMQTIIDMAETLWTNHFRHGTQARSDHTLEEADAAVHMAIPLVRYFVGGLITRADVSAQT
jgi:hypothetical protein